jgi:hypothetical protein
MRPTTRLALFAAGLAVAFVSAFLAGGAVIPQNAAASWARAVHDKDAAHSGHEAGPPPARGLSLSDGNLMLGGVSAPSAVGASGTLSFRIETLAGAPVTTFETENTKQMHLIVVRTDGTEFRHVHPTMNGDGRWSIAWTWGAAGTYRVFADFVPAETGTSTVLSFTVDVGGVFTPRPPANVSSVSQVDGFTVTIDGSLHARTASTLTATITRDGQPVTTLQPYLGAQGHLVALREGDLAYLHAHPEGDQPHTAPITGPRISFVAEPPTPGRYLLYLDFQVDGRVHTAQFVVYAGDPARQAAHE